MELIVTVQAAIILAIAFASGLAFVDVWRTMRSIQQQRGDTEARLLSMQREVYRLGRESHKHTAPAGNGPYRTPAEQEWYPPRRGHVRKEHIARLKDPHIVNEMHAHIVDVKGPIVVHNMTAHHVRSKDADL